MLTDIARVDEARQEFVPEILVVTIVTAVPPSTCSSTSAA
jgi:hypothetical protein